MAPSHRTPRLRVAFFQRVFAHYQAGLVRELARKSRHEYTFFGDDRDPAGTGIEVLPVTLRSQIAFHRRKTVHWGRKLAFQWCAVREALFGDFDAYVFEGSFTIATNWLAIPVARLRRKRVLLYTHGWLRRETGLKAAIRRRFYRLADGLLLYGERARDLGLESGFSADALYVTYNSLDEDSMERSRSRLTPAMHDAFRRKQFGQHSKDPMIVSVGRLTSAKAYSLLVDAAGLLGRQHFPVNILLVGEGPERETLERRAHELGVRLMCPGGTYDEDFLSLCFAAADIAVIPGAAGLSVIHSLSYGTPVIVHDDADSQMPESEAVEPGTSGSLFRCGDAEDLARSIMKTLRQLPRSPGVAAQCRAVVDAAYVPSKMRVVFDDAVSAYPARGE